MARHGARVTGVDLSPTMIAQAQTRTRAAGLDAQFLCGDVTTLDVGRTFDRIVAVTVLQHLLEDGQLDAALTRLRAHLREGGQMVLLEAAPSWSTRHCNTHVFRARTHDDYLDAFARHGLRVVEVTGVDPGILKTLFLPWYRRMPRWLANAVLFALTLVSLPVDVLLGRMWRRMSWHKVFVLEGGAQCSGRSAQGGGS